MLASSIVTAQLAQLTTSFAGNVSSSGGGALCQIWLPSPEGDGSIRLTTQVVRQHDSAVSLDVLRGKSCQAYVGRWLATFKEGALHMHMHTANCVD